MLQNIDLFFYDLLARFYCYISDQIWFCIILHDLKCQKADGKAIHIKTTHFFPNFPSMTISILIPYYYYFFLNIFIFTREIYKLYHLYNFCCFFFKLGSCEIHVCDCSFDVFVVTILLKCFVYVWIIVVLYVIAIEVKFSNYFLILFQYIEVCSNFH